MTSLPRMSVSDAALARSRSDQRDPNTMRYFLYCRRSSEAEDRQVMSIESQRLELNKILDAKPEIKIAGVFEESKSASSPGRPLFSEMLSRIEKGDAAGIIAWAPD